MSKESYLKLQWQAPLSTLHTQDQVEHLKTNLPLVPLETPKELEQPWRHVCEDRKG